MTRAMYFAPTLPCTRRSDFRSGVGGNVGSALRAFGASANRPLIGAELDFVADATSLFMDF